MKSNAKLNLLIIGILLALLSIPTTNLSYITNNSKKSLDYSDESNLDKENLKISAVSGKIHIDNNWTSAKSAGICTGNGTYSDPYVIEDLVIDGEGSGSGIWIANSDVYSRTENCTIYNSGNKSIGIGHAAGNGIRLSNVNNSQLINNNCSSNYLGIFLEDCDNNNISGNIVNDNYQGIRFNDYCDYNAISGNTVNNNENRGIDLHLSDNNSISGNNINNNGGCGIYLGVSKYCIITGNNLENNVGGIFLLASSNNNIISGNNLSYNEPLGIWLFFSDYNTISGNKLIGNIRCWKEENCEGNIFENNDCRDVVVSGYNLFFLLGILSIVAIILSKKLKKS